MHLVALQPGFLDGADTFKKCVQKKAEIRLMCASVIALVQVLPPGFLGGAGGGGGAGALGALEAPPASFAARLSRIW